MAGRRNPRAAVVRHAAVSVVLGAPPSPVRVRGRSAVGAATGLAALFLVAALVLALKREAPAAAAADDDDAEVGRLWTQMFGDRRRLQVVLGTVSGAAKGGPWASLADVRIAQRVGAVAALHDLHVDIVAARDARAAVVIAGDAILTGLPDTNPWIQPLEAHLGFRVVPPRRGATAAFEDVRSDDDVQRFAATEQRGYCRVAWLRSLDGAGGVLLVSGTEAASTEAGLELVTHGPWLERLRRQLDVGPHEPYPHFEALLATQRVGSSVARAELIVARPVSAVGPER